MVIPRNTGTKKHNEIMRQQIKGTESTILNRYQGVVELTATGWCMLKSGCSFKKLLDNLTKIDFPVAIKYEHLGATHSASGWRNLKTLKIFCSGGNTLCLAFLHAAGALTQRGYSDCLSAVIYVYLKSYKIQWKYLFLQWSTSSFLSKMFIFYTHNLLTSFLVIPIVMQQ